MIAEQATGKWRGILTALGVDAAFLTGKHCACPICRGGKDRFRFSDKDGKGLWICNQCGGGDGFSLLMKVTGMDFKACADRVREVIGQVEYATARKKPDTAKFLKVLWKASNAIEAGDIADRYLSSRMIDHRPRVLRTVKSCRTSSGQHHPAMIALVSDAAGNAVTIHRTYLGEKGKAEIENQRELMPGKIPDGSAIRLFAPERHLGIAEGIETALSAAKLFNVPVWASINATMMEKWIPPEGTEQVAIYADADRTYTGQKSAYILANKLTIKGFSVSVTMPPNIGEDWNDVLKRGIA